MTKTLETWICGNLGYEIIDRFQILNFGHCDLSVICDLKFAI